MSTPGQGEGIGEGNQSTFVHADGPPYPPHNQLLGGVPIKYTDVPLCAVFLTMFTLAAIAHMGLFQINLRVRKNKFVFNAVVSVFCLTRLFATAFRISWASQPSNMSLALAEQIFMYAGVPLLFITNLFFVQRIVRAQHPYFGWTESFSMWLPTFIILQIITIVVFISALIVQYYRPDVMSQRWTRDMELYGTTLFAISAVLPLLIVIVSTAAKQNRGLKYYQTDNFGKGSISTKIVLLLVTTIPLSLGAWFRAGTSYLPPVPLSAPSPWYFSKSCFYSFNFLIEILVVIFWLAIRIDKYFIVPDGCRGPHSQGEGTVSGGEYIDEKAGRPVWSSWTTTSDRDSTLPPPTLQRADSWGSVRRYMCKSPSPALAPTLWEPRVDSKKWWTPTTEVSPLPNARYSLYPHSSNWQRSSSVYSIRPPSSFGSSS